MTDHTNALEPGFPPDFAAFAAGRRRFLDRMSADAVLRQAARDARRPEGVEEDTVDPGPLTLHGDLTVLTAERRLVLGYFAPGQRDVADAVRSVLGFEDEAFGVGRVGAVRITIERLPRGAVTWPWRSWSGRMSPRRWPSGRPLRGAPRTW